MLQLFYIYRRDEHCNIYAVTYHNCWLGKLEKQYSVKEVNKESFLADYRIGSNI